MFALAWLAGLLGQRTRRSGLASWSTIAWLVMLMAPACLVAGAAVASGRTPFIARRSDSMPSPRQPRGRHGCFSSARSSAGRSSCSSSQLLVDPAHLRKGRRTPVPACSQPVPSPGHALGTGVGCPVADPSRTGARTSPLSPDRSASAFGATLLAMQAARLEVVTVAVVYGLAAILVYRVNRPRSRGSRCVGRTDGCVVSSVFLLRLPQNPIDGLRVRDPRRGCSIPGRAAGVDGPRSGRAVKRGLGDGPYGSPDALGRPRGRLSTCSTATTGCCQRRTAPQSR